MAAYGSIGKNSTIVRGRFSLDTNILVDAVDLNSGDRHEHFKELLAHGAKRDCVLTVHALSEFFHATTRKKLLQTSLAGAFVRDWLDVFHVISADAATLVEAMDEVEEHRLSCWDAMVWTTVRRDGCSALASEDMQDGRRLGGVEVINPFGTDGTARLATLLEE